MPDKKIRERKDALDHLSYLKVVTRQKMAYGRQTAPYFIVWGTIWFIGYGIEGIGLYALLNTVWAVLGLIGLIMTIWLVIRQSKNDPIPSFFGRQMVKIWGVFLTIIALCVLLIGRDLLMFNYQLLSLYSVFLVSIMHMLLGVVISREMYIMGIWLAILGAITAVWFSDFSGIIFAIIGGGSMVVSGILLLRRSECNE